MSLQAPTLSIIIPCFNAEQTVVRTLRSLSHISSNQCSAVQVIVIDDGSTDRTAALIAQVREEIDEFYWTCLYQPNAGLAVARNKGLQNARGTWVFFLDADDELRCNPMKIIPHNPACTAVLCDVIYETSKGRKSLKPAPFLSLDKPLNQFTAENPLTVSSLLFQREAISHPFNPKLSSLEDWDFWLRNIAIFRSHQTRRIPIATIHLHHQNMSRDLASFGKYRRLVAENYLRDFGEQLSTKQKNNLHLHVKIGAILGTTKAFPRRCLYFPCNLKLYLKWLTFSVFGHSIPTFMRRYR